MMNMSTSTFNRTEVINEFRAGFEQGNTTICPENLCVPQRVLEECVACQHRFIDVQMALNLMIASAIVGAFIGIMIYMTYRKAKE